MNFVTVQDDFAPIRGGVFQRKRCKQYKYGYIQKIIENWDIKGNEKMRRRR